MKELKKFQPAYTGGTFVLMKDEEHALGMNEQKVTLFNLRNMKVIGIYEARLAAEKMWLATGTACTC